MIMTQSVMYRVLEFLQGWNQWCDYTCRTFDAKVRRNEGLK